MPSNILINVCTSIQGLIIIMFLHAYWSLGDNFDHLQYAYSERCDCISNETQFLLMLVNPFIPTVPYSGRITGFVSLF